MRRYLLALLAVVLTVVSMSACASQRRPAAGRPHAPAAGPSAPATQGPSGPTAPAIQSATGPAHVQATAGALADAATRRLLWTRRIDSELPVGSIAKVMTALIVIEAGGLNREIAVPKSVLHYVAKYQGESAGLHPGDVVSVHDLLEAMLLQSGCDAAYVLALTYGPGLPGFLAKMNATATRLGMTRTHFTSPDGLPYPTEYSSYSTPHDLINLGLTAMQSPVFRAIVAQKFFQLRKTKHHHAYWWGNTNDLIGNYRGADGIKTGYTDAAKHCLLFEAHRRDRTLIGVVLGSPVTGPDAGAQAASRLLNWGFALPLPQPAAQAAAG